MRVTIQKRFTDPGVEDRWDNSFIPLIVVAVGGLLRLTLLVFHWGQDPMFLQYSDSYGYYRLAYNMIVSKCYSYDIKPI